MAIRYENQVVFRQNNGHKVPIADADIGQELVDRVVEAYRNRHYEGFAPFPPEQEHVFDTIKQTNRLGIFLEHPKGEACTDFVSSIEYILRHFGNHIRDGQATPKVTNGVLDLTW